MTLAKHDTALTLFGGILHPQIKFEVILAHNLTNHFRAVSNY